MSRGHLSSPCFSPRRPLSDLKPALKLPSETKDVKQSSQGKDFWALSSCRCVWGGSGAVGHFLYASVIIPFPIFSP